MVMLGYTRLEVPGEARRRVRRRADPRQHPARDRLDRDPDDHRPLRRRLQLGDPRRHRGPRAATGSRSTSPRSSSSGRFEYPEQGGPLERAARAGRPPGSSFDDDRARRDPLLLGARVADEEGRRSAGDRATSRREFVVTPDAEGTYSLVCTEFCGIGHATMRAFVVVESAGGVRRLGRRPGGRCPEGGERGVDVIEPTATRRSRSE